MSQMTAALDASRQLERFHNSYLKDNNSGCWNWNLSLSPDGYGRCYFNGVNVRAHRLSYELHNGPFPRHLVVCHKCDNPRCVNPNHLFLGTVQDNMADKKNKGRSKGINKGSKNGMSKVSDFDIEEIRYLLEVGLSQKDIGSLYGLTQSHISRIKNGERQK